MYALLERRHRLRGLARLESLRALGVKVLGLLGVRVRLPDGSGEVAIHPPRQFVDLERLLQKVVRAK